MKAKIQSIFYSALALLALPFISRAALVDCRDNCTVALLFSEIAKVTNWLIGLAGVYAVFWIVLNGFRMVAFAGNEGEVKAAREGLFNAVLGFVLVMVAYIIVNTFYGFFGVKLGTIDSFQFIPFLPK